MCGSGPSQWASVLALIILSLATISTTVSLAVPYWIEHDLGHAGLWKVCRRANIDGDTTCFDIDSKSTYGLDDTFRMIQTVRGLLIAAIVFYFIGCTVGVAYACVDKMVRRSGGWSVLLLLLPLGFLANLMAIILFSTNIVDDQVLQGFTGDTPYGWAYFTAIASASAAFVSLIFYISSVVINCR